MWGCRGGGVEPSPGTFGTNRRFLVLARTGCPSTMALRKPASSSPASSLSLRFLRRQCCELLLNFSDVDGSGGEDGVTRGTTVISILLFVASMSDTCSHPHILLGKFQYWSI